MSDITIIIMLQLLAIAILVAEIIIPSFGVLTAIALGLLGYSYTFVHAAAPDLLYMVIVFNLFSVPATFLLGMKFMGASPAALKKELPAEKVVEYPYTVGDTGVAETDLRPAGKAMIGDHYADVLSTGDYIEKGSKVVIVKIDNGGVQVEAVDGQ